MARNYSNIVECVKVVASNGRFGKQFRAINRLKFHISYSTPFVRCSLFEALEMMECLSRNTPVSGSHFHCVINHSKKDPKSSINQPLRKVMHVHFTNEVIMPTCQDVCTVCPRPRGYEYRVPTRYQVLPGRLLPSSSSSLPPSAQAHPYARAAPHSSTPPANCTVVWPTSTPRHNDRKSNVPCLAPSEVSRSKSTFHTFRPFFSVLVNPA